MARYREKTPEDLAWNRIRREITRAIDTAIMHKREQALNIAITAAFKEFVGALQTGEVREVEAKYTNLASEIVADVVPEELARGLEDD